MRGTTHTVYALIFRTQALFGLGLVAWLVSAVLVEGQYAGMSMLIGVIAGVVSLACLWPYLTPRWLGRPNRRSQLVPLVAAHLSLLALYCFVAISAVIATDLPDVFGRQMALAALTTLTAMSAMSIAIGIRLSLFPVRDDRPGGIVTEFVLPQSRGDMPEPEAVHRDLSRAS